MEKLLLLHSLREVRQLLPSYFNLYQAILHRIRHQNFGVVELAEGGDLSRCVVRLRQRKPELWTVGEIRQIAEALNLPVAVCIKLEAELNRMGEALLVQPSRMYVSLLRVCGLHRLRSRVRLGDRWSYTDLYRLYQGTADERLLRQPPEN
ncbi:hypothetical protein [Tellurirhabdus rosea]|uniref:hypothetical protein n=1 Tax=Tellurirhabdus rosea TaxID=2674997 RepID=UPI0022584EDA|nr:hypothetical protein [Tellurirhabdus rosea]